MSYYNKEGKKIEMMEWAKLLEDFNYKVIKQNTLADGKWISTIWLGLDHSFDEGKPLIFETMVFPKKGNFGELDMERYSTLEEAIIGHKKMVKKFSWTEDLLYVHRTRLFIGFVIGLAMGIIMGFFNK